MAQSFSLLSTVIFPHRRVRSSFDRFVAAFTSSQCQRLAVQLNTENENDIAQATTIDCEQKQLPFPQSCIFFAIKMENGKLDGIKPGNGFGKL